MSRHIFSWKVGGEAGFGIKSAGLLFAKMCNRAGYEVFGYDEYPSLIRGGHNTYQVTVSQYQVASTAENIDILIALNREAVVRHINELTHGGAIIYDRATTAISLNQKQRDMNLKLIDVPLQEFAHKDNGKLVMRNTIALGATQALLGLPFSLLEGVIKKTFAHKADVVKVNVTAARRGYDFVKKNYANIDFKIKLPVRSMEDEMLLTGNDALSLGAIAAGMQMYVAYPMTPSSGILHYLATKAQSEKLIVKHAEDEISVINMALGASHAGVRAMCGTSGGGFSLMVEALGLAGITETPLVIVNAQRPGPATGLPTWTEQGDLRFVMHAAQGEFPRIVIAPGDHEECFYLTTQAFNWADRYQVPVIILTDKFLGESHRTVRPFLPGKVRIDRGKTRMTDAALSKMKGYQRYRITPDGVSPRSIPGQKNGIFLANSDEHDSFGITNEDSANRIAQADKRFRKLHGASAHLGGANLYGNPRAKTTIVAWGSLKGPIIDAMAWLPARVQRKVNFLHINVLLPFPTEAVQHALRRSKKTLLIENNATGQLGGLLMQETGIKLQHHMLKYDGRPIYPIDIKERIMSL